MNWTHQVTQQLFHQKSPIKQQKLNKKLNKKQNSKQNQIFVFSLLFLFVWYALVVIKQVLLFEEAENKERNKKNCYVNYYWKKLQFIVESYLFGFLTFGHRTIKQN